MLNVKFELGDKVVEKTYDNSIIRKGYFNTIEYVIEDNFPEFRADINVHHSKLINSGTLRVGAYNFEALKKDNMKSDTVLKLTISGTPDFLF